MTDTLITTTRISTDDQPPIAIDAETTLRRLDFEVTGPTIDVNRMDVSLCTSTTCSTSGGTTRPVK